MPLCFWRGRGAAKTWMHPNGGTSGMHRRPKGPTGRVSRWCRQGSPDAAQKPDSEITHEISARGDQTSVKHRHRYFPTLAHASLTSLNDDRALRLLRQARTQLRATEDNRDAEG